MKNVIGYFEPLKRPGTKKDVHPLTEHNFELMELWKKSWRNNGWNPIILGSQDAEEHPDYSRLDIKNIDNPLYVNNINGSDYQIACYNRHLAYSNFVLKNGTTLNADCDVINYSFTPEDCDLYEDNSIIGDGVSVVRLSKTGAEDIVRAILKGIEVGPRNDMECYFNLTTVFKVIGSAARWGDLKIEDNILTNYDDCKTSKLVHYHNGLWELTEKQLFNIIHPKRADFIQKFRPILI